MKEWPGIAPETGFVVSRFKSGERSKHAQLTPRCFRIMFKLDIRACSESGGPSDGVRP